MTRFEVWAPDGVPEVRAGDDLVDVITAAEGALADGDLVVVTSKVVSKAEGRVREGGRDEAVEEETVRVVARRGGTRIVRNRLGLTMAAAGVDASNVDAGSVVLLPLDPDRSARELRTALRERTGRNVAVVVTDTSGRTWRLGQTDIAIGAAGLLVADDHAGRADPHGNPLAVTMPALADEIAGAADLAKGKLGARPVAVVRGLGQLVLPPGEDGPGASSLVREEGTDLFGYGATEAVVRALAGDPADRTPFGAPAAREALTASVAAVLAARGAAPGSVLALGSDDSEDLVLEVPDGPDRAVLAALAFAHGWALAEWQVGGDRVRATFSPVHT